MSEDEYGLTPYDLEPPAPVLPPERLRDAILGALAGLPATETLTPYDLSGPAPVRMEIQPGWQERIKELAPKVIDVDPASLAGGAMVTWLRQQILYDRHDAQACADEPEIADRWEESSTGVLQAGTDQALDQWQYCWPVGDGRVSRHIVRHDPLNVIADCDAKLLVLDEYTATRVIADAAREQPGGVTDGVYGLVRGLERVVRLLASGYRHRPGYRQEWAP